MFIAKVMQFQELLDVRHSVMLLGPAGAGKSTIYQTLVACKNVDQPKPLTCVRAGQSESRDGRRAVRLHGCPRTGRTGVYPSSCGTCASAGSRIHLGPDGSVGRARRRHRRLIESMNTVMDDNKVLTLVSNERIPLTPAMRMVLKLNLSETRRPRP